MTPDKALAKLKRKAPPSDTLNVSTEERWTSARKLAESAYESQNWDDVALLRQYIEKQIKKQKQEKPQTANGECEPITADLSRSCPHP
jgi:hypothetical protein